ncbi:Dam family site-specific DNA-(adenine-N6)-methyltransferase [Tepidanaerobacter sp. EBM-38]|uniref:DNA adenine methylase n=1 Tax=Tepidanaerobacter sp. EBM-38 TaxID=1918496 RepID=UPI000AB6508C|nr:Dam family site-specific DNA-(adenine-N6)-methyltransferase [Tepidanaerobacter sp. EBM-38]
MQNSELILCQNTGNIFEKEAKPFVKWAGGKTQLLNELSDRLPLKIKMSKTVQRYVEPFVGGGAFFFFLKSNYEVKESFLYDINKELIIGYKVIQKDVQELMYELERIEDEYINLPEIDRKEYYYKTRDEYNNQQDNFNYETYNSDWIKRAAYLIFLNKTCFNGLFRQNKRGKFNVPFGRYKNPTICDKENLLRVNEALKNTYVFSTDFEESKKFIDANTLVYLDPPYRPLNKTSYFTSYDKSGFTDEDQIRLANYYKEMDKKGAFLILSNSDPKNANINDNFFETLYAGYKIERVLAKRSINCDGAKRNSISELIIRNYE